MREPTKSVESPQHNTIIHREDLRTELEATKSNVQKNEFELEQLKRDILQAERELKGFYWSLSHLLLPVAIESVTND